MNYYIVFFFLFIISACNKKGVSPIVWDPAGNNTYYLDSRTGNDQNDGLSPATPWKTLTRAGQVNYKEGDKVLLKRGKVFAGKLSLQAAGTAGKPVEVGAWPENDTTAPLPLIDARGYLAGIEITNSSGLVITGLEIISDAGEPVENKALKKRYGVMVTATLSGFADAHASTASIAALTASGQLAVQAAPLPVLLAVSCNSLSKCLVAWVSDGRRFAGYVIGGQALLTAATWLGLLIG